MPDNVQPLWSEDDLDTALATLRSDVDTDRRAGTGPRGSADRRRSGSAGRRSG
jgi:hypothetical protein